MPDTKLCKDCKHYESSWPLTALCARKPDLVYGGMTGTPCITERGWGGNCKPSGVLFTPKRTYGHLMVAFLLGKHG